MPVLETGALAAKLHSQKGCNMITVCELIGLLQKFPGGARVVVRGYEHGVDDIVEPSQIHLNLNVNGEDKSYAGPHEIIELPPGFSWSPSVFIDGVRRHDREGG